MQRGVTLIELAVVLTVAGILMALAVPRAAGWLDRIAVQRSAGELSSFYHRGRLTAVFQSSTIRLEFAADTLRAVLEGWRDSTAFVQPGPARYGCRLRATRRVIRIYPNGLGRGAANTRLVVERGMAAETLTTSRLGRLKRW